MKTIKKRVYYIQMPFPNFDNEKVRMVSCHLQPYFFITDVAKLFKMTPKKALKIAAPHLTEVMHVKLTDMYGYWRLVLFGTSKRNRRFQHAFVQKALNSLYEDTIAPYLQLVQKSKNKTKGVKSKMELFK